MINFDHDHLGHNSNWPKFSNFSNRILIMGDSASGNTNSIFNLISHQQDIDKIY